MKVTDPDLDAGSVAGLGRDFWDHDWPQLEIALTKVVRRRLPRAALADAEDIVQHVAEVLVKPRAYPSAGHVRRFATVVACNQIWRSYRGVQRQNRLERRLSATATSDVEDTAINRLRLECLKELISNLGEQDRAALRADRAAAPMSGAAKTRRSRVKRLLRERLEAKVGGGLLLPRLRWLVGGLAAGTALMPSVIPLLPTPAEEIPIAGPRSDGETASPAVAARDSAAVGPLQRGLADRHPGADEEREAPAGGTYTADLEVRGPGGVGAGTGEWEPGPEDGPQSLVCVMGLDPAPPVCVSHPTRP